MSSLYDVLNDGSVSGPEPKTKPRLSKEEFAKQMREKRAYLFNLANEQTSKSVSNPQNYKSYLDLQARLGYTVTNTLLVFAQNPNATLVKDTVRWRDDGKYIRKNEKGIQILEPSGEFERRDGSRGINYNPKYVFDVTQVNGNVTINQPDFSAREILKAVTHNTDVKPEVVAIDSNLPADVYFDEKSKTIYVREQLEPSAMITGVIREYCVSEAIDKDNHRSELLFEANSAAYMICQKYGIKGYDTSFLNQVQEHFAELEQKEQKAGLENIAGLFNGVSQRMEHGFYHQQQDKGPKQQNRNVSVR